MKRWLVLGLLLFLGCSCSYSQAVTQKMLIGKWYLIRHTEDSLLILDLENPELTANYYLDQLRQQKPDCTRQDSIDLAENVYRTISGFENYFMEYREDGTYSHSVIKSEENKASEETEGGTYKFIPAEQKIIQTEANGKKHEARVSIRNKVLRLEIKVNSTNYIMEFKKR